MNIHVASNNNNNNNNNNMIMKDAFRIIWSEGTVLYFKVIFNHRPGQILENHVQAQSG